jgi:hypothetical protein
VTGPYGVNREGSGDMYFKGNNMIHTIRQVIDNDELFRQILRGLNATFYHKTVTSAEVEKYIIDKSGKDLSKVFRQYLSTTTIPTLEWKTDGRIISYHWAGCIAGFNMPVRLKNGAWLKPETTWKTIDIKQAGKVLQVNENFYIQTKKV